MVFEVENFATVELNCNLLENICSCAIVLCDLTCTGAVSVLQWEILWLQYTQNSSSLAMLAQLTIKWLNLMFKLTAILFYQSTKH